MPSRARTLACTFALSTAALVAAAPAAYADTICQTTTGGPFDGTVVCVNGDYLTVNGTRKLPYSVGGVCVDGYCPVEPISGELDVPNVQRAPGQPVFGQVCGIPGAHGQRYCAPIEIPFVDWG